VPKYEDVLEMTLSIASTVSRFRPLYDRGAGLPIGTEWATEPEWIGEVRVTSRGQEILSVVSQVSASRVSVASRVVNPKHDELRPAVSTELYQLHRKIGVYKMSNN